MTPMLAERVETAARAPRNAADSLFSNLYADLHRMARRELAKQGGSASLGPTTLLHEAYLNMSGRASASFSDDHQFMAYASRVMRGLIIDHVRGRQAQKRGGEFEITSISADVADAVAGGQDLTGIGDALDELAMVDARLAQVVDLKFFCGLSFAEIAAMQAVSERTVQRDWEKARVYLHRALNSTAA